MPLLAGGFRGVADGFVEGEEERDVVAEVGGGRGEVGEEGGGVELVEGVEEGSALLLVVLWGGGGRAYESSFIQAGRWDQASSTRTGVTGASMRSRPKKMGSSTPPPSPQ